MNRKCHSWTFAALLALLAALAPLSPLAATESQQSAEVDLTGVISRNEAGRFVLVEGESGSSIVLEAEEPQKLADNEGTEVKITGRWSANRDTFRVSSVEPIVEVVPPPLG